MDIVMVETKENNDKNVVKQQLIVIAVLKKS